MGREAYANTLRLPLVSADHLGQRRDGQLGSARELAQIYSCAFLHAMPCQMCISNRGLLNRAVGRGRNRDMAGAFPVTVKRPRGERAFHLSAAATNMPAHLFALSPFPASSANGYRNILAGRSLFSFFTKDVELGGERESAGEASAGEKS